MMVLLRALARLIDGVWMLALALLGLGIAVYCLDALISLGSARPDRLVDLASVGRHVGRFLDQIAARGPTAGLALLCGLGAMLLGILLLLGTLSRPKQHLAVLEQDTDTGALAARPRTLREMARAMAEQARGATSVKRPKLSLSRDGTQGRLTVKATHARSTDPHALERAVLDAVGPITEPFGLKPRVRVRLGQRGTRVQ
jgi:hypothetical protein